MVPSHTDTGVIKTSPLVTCRTPGVLDELLTGSEACGNCVLVLSLGIASLFTKDSRLHLEMRLLFPPLGRWYCSSFFAICPTALWVRGSSKILLWKRICSLFSDSLSQRQLPFYPENLEVPFQGGLAKQKEVWVRDTAVRKHVVKAVCSGVCLGLKQKDCPKFKAKLSYSLGCKCLLKMSVA